MIKITLQRRRPDGSLAKVVLNATIKESDVKDDKELAELLLRTEIGANESGDIRAWIFMEEG